MPPPRAERRQELSDRRTIINGNRVFRFDCERCRRTRGDVNWKNSAFTLAEVLITLGIIGIVAAVTMPTLITNHREKVTVTRLTQTYSLLSQALEKMIQDESQTIQYWGSTSAERITKFEKLLPEYVDVIKKCPKVKKGCIADSYRAGVVDAPANASIPGITGDTNSFLLKNGIAIKTQSGGYCFQNMTLGVPYPDNPNQYMGTYGGSCFELFVDINGPAGPNKTEVDTFKFKVVQDGLVPAGSAKETIWTDIFDGTCTKFTQNTWGNCTAWVIYNKNMDYLHCPEKLGWNKASSCK